MNVSVLHSESLLPSACTLLWRAVRLVGVYENSGSRGRPEHSLVPWLEVGTQCSEQEQTQQIGLSGLY
jgi:hypothetical protein